MKFRIGTAIAWFSVFLLLVFLVGCSDTGNEEEEEREGGNYGPVVIGPGDHYRAHEQGRHDEGRDTEGHQRYRSDHVTVTGQNVRPENGPAFNRFNLSMNNVHYHHTPLHVISVGNTTFSGQVSEGNVNSFLNGRAQRDNTGMRDVHMRFLPGQVQMTAMYHRNNRDMSIYSTGTFRPDGGNRLIYVPRTITASNAPLPPDVQQDFLNQMNPVMDLGSLKCAPQVQHVTINRGMLTVSGPATVTNMP